MTWHFAVRSVRSPSPRGSVRVCVGEAVINKVVFSLSFIKDRPVGGWWTPVAVLPVLLQRCFPV